MARVQIQRRIGKEFVRVRMTYGGFEAVAEVEDRISIAFQNLCLGSRALTERVISEGLAGAGFDGDADAEVRRLIGEVGFTPINALAVELVKKFCSPAESGDSAAGEPPAAGEAETTVSGSTT